jgi:hypothetical protein
VYLTRNWCRFHVQLYTASGVTSGCDAIAAVFAELWDPLICLPSSPGLRARCGSQVRVLLGAIAGYHAFFVAFRK